MLSPDNVVALNTNSLETKVSLRSSRQAAREEGRMDLWLPKKPQHQ